MGTEARELVYWVRKWIVVNDGLLQFAIGSHALHPFDFPRNNSDLSVERGISHHDRDENGGNEMTKSGDHATASPQIMQNVGKENQERVEEDEKDEASPNEAVYAEASEIGSMSILYGHVYGILSTYGKVEFWSNAVILQHMLSWSLRAWVEQLCECSNDCLKLNPIIVKNELVPPELTWTSTAVDSLWEQAFVANREPWAASVKSLRRATQSSEHAVLLHSLVAFAVHFRRMRWLLKVVFLRVDVSMNDVACRTLRNVVNSTLQFNSATIRAILYDAVERSVRDVEPRLFHSCDSVNIYNCNENEEEKHKGESGDESGKEEQDESQQTKREGKSQQQEMEKECSPESIRQLLDDDLIGVSAVLAMLDTCRVDLVTTSLMERVVELSQNYGLRLAHGHLGPLCYQGVPTSPEDTPTLQGATNALQHCMRTYRRMRGTMQLLLGSAARPTDEVSELGHEHVARVANAFSVGLCQCEEFPQFLDAWALQLWMRACEEEFLRRSSPFLENSKGHLHESLPASVTTATTTVTLPGVEQKSPWYGFTSLVFFLSPASKQLAEFESRFSVLVARHLEELLASTLNSTPSEGHGGSNSNYNSIGSTNTGGGLRSLPRDVYQHCVFLLRMTSRLLDPLMASSGDGARAALRAVRNGLRAFFLDREPCVILTIASALHSQAVDGAMAAGASLEVVDTIMDVAALLRSRDLFVDCYCGLLAPRLMAMRSASEIALDAEIVARLRKHLGPSLAESPEALVRDTLNSLSDLRCGAVSRELAVGGVGVGLIRQIHVLCAARWVKFATVTLPLSVMQRYHCEENWFDDAMLRAARRFERQFKHMKPEPPNFINMPGDTPSDEMRRASSANNHNEGERGEEGETNERAEEDEEMHPAVAYGMLAHNSTHPDHGIYGEEDYDNESGSEGEEDEGEEDENDDGNEDEGGRRRKRRNSSHSCTNNDSHTTHTPPHAVWKKSYSNHRGTVSSGRCRLFTWSLGSGSLTITCRSTQPAAEVTLVVPPVGLLVLKALARHGTASNETSSTPRCTFEELHGCMPLDVPKPLLGTILRELVRHRIAVRVRHSDGVCTYALAKSFAACKRRRVVIEATAATHHWAPHSQLDTSEEAAAAAVNGIVEVERMKKLEAGIVRTMKSRRRMSHVDLFLVVSSLLRAQFVVTAPMMKKCIAQLIERDFIARDERDVYTYVS